MTAPRKQVKITVNGKEVVGEEGRPLLQSCLDSGVEVPHFCYHPGIGVEGSCRLCLVDVQGAPKLQTSCTVPVKEGMVVSTKSAAVKKARKGVLEFFLLNHPLDCPICDKGGECPLQNYSLDSGQSESRMEFTKNHKAKHQVIGDHIVLDKERCVLCNRCVRFLRDFTGREELHIINRGSKSEIYADPSKPLTNGFTGNLADICPVGSLTTREFRFRARPWELKTHASICGECSLGCAIDVWKKKTSVVRVTPRIEPETNEWWLCDRGRFSTSLIHPNRLTSPHKPGNGFEIETPSKLVSELNAQIQRLPEGTMAFVVDANLSNEEFFALRSIAKGTRARIFLPMEAAHAEVVRKCESLGVNLTSPGHLESSSGVLIAGAAIERTQPVLFLRIHRLARSIGLKVHTAGPENLGFESVPAVHMRVDESDADIKKYFESLSSLLGGASMPEPFPDFGSGDWTILINDTWIRESTRGAIMDFMKAVSDSGRRHKVGVLHTGANLRGYIDQWQEDMRPLRELLAQIQHGKVHGLFWFGKINRSPDFDEYVKGMRVFAHVVSSSEDAHRQADWVLPNDTFYEKSGTLTNTFGRVQRVNRAVRIVNKGYEPLGILTAFAGLVGLNLQNDPAQLYGEIATERPSYPKTLADIPESRHTYTHYERAQWR